MRSLSYLRFVWLSDVVDVTLNSSVVIRQGCFDKIVSVGMFEHGGPKNYEIYFDTAKESVLFGGVRR